LINPIECPTVRNESQGNFDFKCNITLWKSWNKQISPSPGKDSPLLLNLDDYKQTLNPWNSNAQVRARILSESPQAVTPGRIIAMVDLPYVVVPAISRSSSVIFPPLGRFTTSKVIWITVL